MGYPVPLTSEDWGRIRYEYESTARTVAEICAEHGISDGTLRDRVRRWGWKRRWSGPVPRDGPPPIAVSIVDVQAPQGSPGDPPGDIDELRESLKRQIDAIIEEERQARPRRYLAAWEEFAAEAANATPPDADDAAGQTRRPSLAPSPTSGRGKARFRRA